MPLHLDVSKIISGLLILAITLLFNSISELSKNVAALNQQMAVIEEHNTLREEQFMKAADRAEAIGRQVISIDKRVTTLEWAVGKRTQGDLD